MIIASNYIVIISYSPLVLVIKTQCLALVVHALFHQKCLILFVLLQKLFPSEDGLQELFVVFAFLGCFQSFLVLTGGAVWAFDQGHRLLLCNLVVGFRVQRIRIFMKAKRLLLLFLLFFYVQIFHYLQGRQRPDASAANCLVYIGEFHVLWLIWFMIIQRVTMRKKSNSFTRPFGIPCCETVPFNLLHSALRQGLQSFGNIKSGSEVLLLYVAGAL